MFFCVCTGLQTLNCGTEAFEVESPFCLHPEISLTCTHDLLNEKPMHCPQGNVVGCSSLVI